MEDPVECSAHLDMYLAVRLAWDLPEERFIVKQYFYPTY